MTVGRLIKGIGGFYYVDVEKEVYECKARGIFRKRKIIPMVGDRVNISIIDEEKKVGVIEEIFERKNELLRPSVANVDQVVVVFAVAKPDPHLSLLDRFLVLAENQKLDTIICLNKIDLLDEEKYQRLIGIYNLTGYKVLLTSSKSNKGIDSLLKILDHKTTVFAGPSGVGKSTLLNYLYPGLQLKTGEISEKIARGKHTTRHAELIPINETSWVVDTPGFSSLSIDFIGEEELDMHFPDFLPYIRNCKFNSCLHINEPGCEVKEGVKMGEISMSRYESYIQLLGEIKKNRRY